MATSPLGPYEYKGEIIDNSGSDPAVWNNHGSLVEYKGQWYVLYHRPTRGSVSSRKACIEPIQFRDDGTIKEVEMTSQGAAGPLNPYEEIDARRACILLGNVRIDKMEINDEEYLAGIKDGDKVCYKYLDFGDQGPKDFYITMKVKKPCTITVATDQSFRSSPFKIAIPWTDEDGVFVGSHLEVPYDALKGVHAIWLTFSEGATPVPWGESREVSGEDLLEVYSFVFEE